MFSFMLIIINVLLNSCSDRKEKYIAININKIHSSNVIVIESYQSFISKMGHPDYIYKTYFRKYRDDYSCVTDSCETLVYVQKGLRYVLLDSIVYLRSINFNIDSSRVLHYYKCALNGSFNIEEAKNFFNVVDSCLFHVSSEYLMCGTDTSGYILLYPDENRKDSFYEFYFGSDSLLKMLTLPIYASSQGY